MTVGKVIVFFFNEKIKRKNDKWCIKTEYTTSQISENSFFIIEVSVSSLSLIFSETYYSSSQICFFKCYSCLSVKIRFKSKDPLWEDCFSFLVHNPRRQELEVEVKLHNSSLTAT